jgi:hypothetical protein
MDDSENGSAHGWAGGKTKRVGALLRPKDGSSKLLADSYGELRRVNGRQVRGYKPFGWAPFATSLRASRTHSVSPHIRPPGRAQCKLARPQCKQAEHSARNPPKGRPGVCTSRTQRLRAGLSSAAPTALGTRKARRSATLLRPRSGLRRVNGMRVRCRGCELGSDSCWLPLARA